MVGIGVSLQPPQLGQKKRRGSPPPPLTSEVLDQKFRPRRATAW